MNIPQFIASLNTVATTTTNPDDDNNSTDRHHENNTIETGNNTTITTTPILPGYLMYCLQLHSEIGQIGAITGTLNYTTIPNSVIEYAVGDGNTCKILTDGYIQHSGFTTNVTLNYALDYTHCGSNMTRSVGTNYDTFYLTARSHKDGLTVQSAVTLRDMI